MKSIVLAVVAIAWTIKCSEGATTAATVVTPTLDPNQCVDSSTTACQGLSLGKCTADQANLCPATCYGKDSLNICYKYVDKCATNTNMCSQCKCTCSKNGHCGATTVTTTTAAPATTTTAQPPLAVGSSRRRRRRRRRRSLSGSRRRRRRRRRRSSGGGGYY